MTRLAAFIGSLLRAPRLAAELDQARSSIDALRGDAAYWRGEYLRVADRGKAAPGEGDRPTEPFKPVDAGDRVRGRDW